MECPKILAKNFAEKLHSRTWRLLYLLSKVGRFFLNFEAGRRGKGTNLITCREKFRARPKAQFSGEKLLNYNVTLLVYASSKPRFCSFYLSLSLFLYLDLSCTLEFRTSLRNLNARLSEVALWALFSVNSRSNRRKLEHRADLKRLPPLCRRRDVNLLSSGYSDYSRYEN